MKSKVSLLFLLILSLISCHEFCDIFCPYDDPTPVPTPAPTYNPNPSSTENPLDVPFSQQNTEVWCWAACTQMVLNFYDINYSQSYIVSYVFGYPAYTGANDYQLLYALNGIGNMNARVYYNTMSYFQVCSIIDNGNPFIAGYQGSFSGHVVVIYGYDVYQNLYIHDPYFGSFIVPFTNTFSYNQGSMYWAKSFIDLYPIGYDSSKSSINQFKQRDETATILNIDNISIE